MCSLKELLLLFVFISAFFAAVREFSLFACAAWTADNNRVWLRVGDTITGHYKFSGKGQPPWKVISFDEFDQVYIQRGDEIKLANQKYLELVERR